jgi:hypothetical protein
MDAVELSYNEFLQLEMLALLKTCSNGFINKRIQYPENPDRRGLYRSWMFI